MTPNPIESHIIEGTLTESNGDGANDITIYFLNNTTLQTGSTKTNSSGLYIFDLANMSSGWTNGDKITIYARPSGWKEGMDVCDFLARKLRTNFTANWENIKQYMFNLTFANDNPMPFDEENQLFRRTMTLQFRGLNVGELS